MSATEASGRGGAGAPELTVIVPVYNEEANLEALHARLSASLRAFGKSYELVFVDDGSTDGSYDRLRVMHAADETVRVVRFVRNFGQQMAVTAGFRHARGQVIVLIDADLQTSPEDIPLLVTKLREGYDIVYGLRQHRKDPLIRRAGSWFISRLLYRITGIDMPDSSSGFIALDRRLVDSINLFNERSKYFSGLFAWLSYGRWASVPVQHAPRRAGESKYNLKSLVALTLSFVCSFSVQPLRFSAFVGAGLMLAALVALGALGVWGALHEMHLSGLAAVLVAFMAFFTGLQLCFLGILGEYLARVYGEVKGRPPFVVREVLDHDGSRSDADAGEAESGAATS